ncbi:hypothetical protein D0N36_15680 [Hymenobacter lapidiphilus]|nr:hypothetical protein D0N36_15680 [Hymenobacter sp. CCM 8763]
MMIIVWAFYILFKWLNPNNVNEKKSNMVWLSAGFLLIYLYAMPDIFQGFFWYTGAAVYQIGNILLVAVFVTSYQVLTSEAGKRKAILIILNILFVIAAAATNEVVLVQMGGTIGVCFLASIYQRNRAWRWWLMLGLIALFAALLSLIAPGNFVRMDALHDVHAHSVVYSIPRSVFSALELLTSYKVWTSLFLITIIWMPWANKIAAKEQSSFLRVHPVISLIVIFAIVCLCYFPFWWIFASYTPPRTVNSIVFFLMVSWVVTMQATVNWMYQQKFALPQLPAPLVQGAVYVFAVVLLLRMTTLPAVLELVLNARKYDAHMTQRYAYIDEQKKAGNLNVRVDSVTIENRYSILMLAGTDITTHSADEKNRYYADYFQLDSIQIAHEPVLPADSTRAR